MSTMHAFPKVKRNHSLLAGAALLALLGASACSSGGSAGTGGVGGGAPAAGGAGVPSALVYKPCPVATDIGGFAMTLGSPTIATQVNGKVKDAVAPGDVTQVLAQSDDGACQIMIGPELTCGTDCANGTTCGSAGTCVHTPVAVSVGKVTLSGLGSAASIGDQTTTSYYTSIPKTSFPPYVVGNALGLTTAGGVYTPLSLSVRGIAPLDVPDQALVVAMDQPLTVTWTPVADAAGAGRISITMDIAHHGGIAAQLICDWPDTGTGTVPGTLITKLLARGTAGFPIMTIARESVDSAVVEAGCVEYKVLSSVEKMLMVEGITSCSSSSVPPLPCPDGSTCGSDMKCH
jgi:hypothetical protein